MNFPLLLAQEVAAPVHPLADWMSRLEGDKVFVITLVAICCATGIATALITSVTHLVQTLRMGKLKSQLIHSLMDRGYSPADIRELVSLADAPNGLAQSVKSVTEHVRRPGFDVPPAKPLASSRP